MSPPMRSSVRLMSSTVLFTVFACALFGLVLSAGGALAQEPKTLGNFKAWNSYSGEIGGQTTCYAIVEAEERLPANVDHGDVAFLVTNWKSTGVKNIPSFVTGYTFKEGSVVTAEVGSSKWELFTQKNRAWLRETKDEQTLIKAMKRGSVLRMKGLSARGTKTEYSMSLSGVTAAIKKIDSACR